MDTKKIKLSSNRSFGIVFFIVFLLISLWPLFNESNIRYWSLIIAIAFFVLGILNSKILTPLNKIWFKFGLFLGAIISPIVMGIVFFFVVVPTGLIMRLMRKDILKLKKNNLDTYWIQKSNQVSSMKDQF